MGDDPLRNFPTEERPAKRARLSLACNQCRKRKVKCDAEMPKCRNCRIRGQLCETTDPKHPELVVVRKWSGMRDHPDGSPVYEPRHDILTQPIEETSSSATTLRPPPSGSTLQPVSRSAKLSEDQFRAQDPRKASLQREISWIARSYNENMDASSPTPYTTQVTSQAPKSISHESPDMAVNSDGSRDRRKLLGGSSSQSLTMFLDIYLERQGLPQIAPCFRYGMHHAEEISLPLSLVLLDLPPPSLMLKYLQTYADRVHPMFPVLDMWHFQGELSRLRSLQDSHWSPSSSSGGLRNLLKHSDIPSLVCVYCIASIGADETSGKATDVGRSYLKAAYGLYAHLVALPCVSSVQALIVLTLALRGQSIEGQGCQTLGQAIRIAQSIGLHRYIQSKDVRSTEESNYRTQDNELHARVWWSAFSLDKLMELETARPSVIRNSDCDQILPSNSTTDAADYFAHWVSLASILGHISDLLYRTKRRHQSALQLLQSAGKLDRALTEWSNSLPEEIRPGNDLFCTSQELHLASFLSIQFHQALIILHRAALVFPSQEYIKQIDMHRADLPWRLRLQKGLDICVASARAIVKLSAELAEKPSILLVGTPPMLACVVLGLRIVKQPQSRMVRSDLELLVSSSHFAEDTWREGGQSPEFLKICAVLRESLTTFVQKHQTRKLDVISTPSSEAPMRQIPIQENTGASTFIDGNLEQYSNHTILDSGRLEPFEELFKDFALEDFWTFLGANSGFTGFNLDPLDGFNE